MIPTVSLPGLASVTARINQIEAMVGVRQPATASASAPVHVGAQPSYDTVAAQTNLSGSSSSATGTAVVATAKKYLGIPYLWGGTDPSKGLDCSALVQLVYREHGIELPRVTYDQVKEGKQVASLSEAKPGDLLFFGNDIGHVAIYIGDGKMLHAPRTGAVVRIEDVWTNKPLQIRRVLPETSAASMMPVSTMSASATSGPLALPGAAPYRAMFVDAGTRHGVSPQLLAAVAHAESRFNPTAKSPAGAEGLMQFMPATSAGMRVNPWDPSSAIDGAARLLASHMRQFGSVELALAAYNAGPGNVTKYGGIPPFDETRNYVSQITGMLR